MKNVFRIAGTLLLCATLVCPMTEARGRNERGRQQPSRTGQQASRPGNMGQGQSNGNGQSRPDKPTGHNQGNNRPDNNKPGSNKHGKDKHGNNRPGPGGPIGSHHPEYRPQHHGNGNRHHGPMRPMPPHHSWYRPTPPPQWRPPQHWRPLRSVLGITFGTAIDMSLNALIHSGYTVSSYNSNSVFVNNVPMLNMMWPDAILFYNELGGLCGSRFMFSSGFYDMNRYNLSYASLVNAYGAPASVQSTSSGMEATWWGTGSQFIRLSFSSQYDEYGDIRYYTTLSFGN